jgi:hypothetical protein
MTKTSDQPDALNAESELLDAARGPSASCLSPLADAALAYVDALGREKPANLGRGWLAYQLKTFAAQAIVDDRRKLGRAQPAASDMERAKQLILLLPEFDLLDENSWPSMEQTLAAALAEARQEERERCAKMVEGWADSVRYSQYDPDWRGKVAMYETIAAAIRNLP